MKRIEKKIEKGSMKPIIGFDREDTKITILSFVDCACGHIMEII